MPEVEWVAMDSKATDLLKRVFYWEGFNSNVPKSVGKFISELMEDTGNNHPFLFGSAYFTWSHVFVAGKSDIDVAIPYDMFVEEYLSSSGFVKKEQTEYKDYSHMFTYEGEIDGQKVQISFKKPGWFEAFKTVWRNISHEFYTNFFFKGSSKYMGPEGVCMTMDMMLDLARMSKPTPTVSFEEALDSNVPEPEVVPF